MKGSFPVSQVSVAAQISMCSDIIRSHNDEILFLTERAFHRANRNRGPLLGGARLSEM